MPFNAQLSSVENNNVETKRGIFRNKTNPPAQIVRPKLTNVIPMKPDRRKFQSKIFNRKEKPTESNFSVKRSQSYTLSGKMSENIMERPTRLRQESIISDSSQMDYYRTKNSAWNGSDTRPVMKDSADLSKNLIVNSVHSIMYQMEHLKVNNKSTTSDVESLFQKGKV